MRNESERGFIMCRRSYAHHALFPTVAVLSSEEPSYPRSFLRFMFLLLS